MAAVARLKPDVTLRDAQNDLTVIAGRLAQQHQQTDADWVFRIVPLHSALVGDLRPAWHSTTEIGHDPTAFADGL